MKDLTREEAVKVLLKMNLPKKPSELEALDMAIKALREPSAEKTGHTETVTEFADRCRECGKRYVKRQTGHWIEKEGFDGDVYYDCSECGESWTTIEGTPWNNGMNFCPNCGCRMVEPQERSDKE